MSDIAPASGVNAAASSAATDPGAASANAEMQQAFADGIVQFMGAELQSVEGDVQQACNDTTSDPDAPS